MKYQKAVEEGVYNDQRLIEYQREFTSSKYTNLSRGSISQNNNDLGNSQVVFSRKFSNQVEQKLSHTVISNNDSNIGNSTIISPTKEYQTERLSQNKHQSQSHYSPLRIPANKSRNSQNMVSCSRTASHASISQLQKARISKQNNLFPAK
jgi:hypothetical protein